MAFLGKGSKVDLQYMATEMGVEDVLGMRVFELRDAILNSEYFNEEFCREFLNTIIEERERKEEIELYERKRKEERELAERKRKEEMEIAERKRRADFEQKVSTNRGNIGNEVRSNLSSETRLKVEVEDRLKAYEEVKAVQEGRKMEEEKRVNEIIALEEEMRLKNERWLVEEQMRHVQKEHETSMKKQKCLLEERLTQTIKKVLVSKGEQIQTRSTDQYAVAQSVGVEKEKEEILADVIKDKSDLNPVILSKERIDFDEDEIEEEKPKLPKRKRKNLSRMTVVELQQKVNLKASSNMRDGTVKIRRSSRENRSTRKRVRLKLRPEDNIYRDGKVRVETRHLDFKIFDPAWMKQGVARKLRESEIEFQKRFKRRAKPKVTIRGDKASPCLYWDRGKRSSVET
ncbi:uncharacterized protein TNCV_865211 [Trichonephila clavipes]|nr:uncharacterized protein TNCV_865211 [Trichonephila clavipes]